MWIREDEGVTKGVSGTICLRLLVARSNSETKELQVIISTKFVAVGPLKWSSKFRLHYRQAAGKFLTSKNKTKNNAREKCFSFIR